MKPLKEYLLSESSTSVSIMQPRTNGELKGLVEELIKERGTKADLKSIEGIAQGEVLTVQGLKDIKNIALFGSCVQQKRRDLPVFLCLCIYWLCGTSIR